MDLIDGVFLDAGDIDLYIKVQGTGNPPIVIEPAIGGLSVEWYFLQKELAKITTVVTYDRAGYGESPTSKQPRTSYNIANELFNLLFNSDVEHPYILLGHLEGGLYAQHFARLFHHYVAGLILVDSLFPGYFALETEDYPGYNEIASYRTRIENLSKLADMDNETFKQRIVPLIEELYSNFPDEYRVPLVTYQTEKRFFQTAVKEMEALTDSLKEVENGNAFPAIPLLVVAHDPKVMENLSISIGIPAEEARQIETYWLEGQQQLSRLSPFGKFLIAENSDKNIHYSNPMFLLEAVKKMIDDIRSSE
ncbi:MAG: alpha/beta fold hydrolase [Candidatus Kapaibacteriota bacterium]|jgi:pimeloyl-ACP methyl ester carboxylesterase